LVALSRRRLNKKKARRRVILLLLLLLAIFNFDKILQLIYPIPYQETITFYGELYNVDPLLIAAVIKTESNFNSKAVSERGAMGLMQIMPDTGAWVAGQMGEANYDHDILFVPETNIKFGTWYIADLAKEFGDNTVLILAAYNGGRGNVAEWLADNTKGYYTGVEFLDINRNKQDLIVRFIFARMTSQSLAGRRTKGVPGSGKKGKA
jgi:soluble lytic murein transglycosylase